ncbi:MAG: flagellar regulator YcgR PilZN domain-containing protein [Gallionellaceae bacterium]|jgi:c-di-GMP-binding flagellar brake protein YcgR
MLREKEIPLKIEAFPLGGDSDFLIHSQIEIKNILQTICERNTRSALYYDGRRNFFLTMVLAVNEEGIWIDPASRSADNRHLLNSDEIVFVSIHNNTKVQFVATTPWQVAYESGNAIFLPLPQQLLRLQRRDYYRLDALPQHPLKCVLNPLQDPHHIKHEARVMDISVGGLSLVCQEKDFELTPGSIYPDCEIDLPEVGTLTATLQVKNIFDVTSRAGKVNRRAGCVFVKPGRETTLPLQRYVAQMQRQAAVTGANR